MCLEVRHITSWNFETLGRQPINIENVSASCTCTDVSVVSRSIGQNDTIEVLFDYTVSDNDSAQDLQFAIDISDGRIAVNKLKMVSYREIVVEGESSLSLGSLKAGKSTRSDMKLHFAGLTHIG
ncbi:MAG: DUF1573 domain-containing protein [Pirellulaceae bacterium]